ncbi:hypothetical protein GQ457_16G017950 [Hibiscus cannabinus]
MLEEALEISRDCVLLADLTGVIQADGEDLVNEAIPEAADSIIREVAASILGVPAPTEAPVVPSRQAPSLSASPSKSGLSKSAPAGLRRTAMPVVPEHHEFDKWCASRSCTPPATVQNQPAGARASSIPPPRPHKRQASSSDPSRAKRSRPSTLSTTRIPSAPKAGMSNVNNSPAETARLSTICDGLRQWQRAKRAADWERIPCLRLEINRLRPVIAILPSSMPKLWPGRRRMRLWAFAMPTATGKLLLVSPLAEAPAFLEHIPPSVTEDMNSGLMTAFTADEVIAAFRDINPRKSPGIDGLPSGFFRQHWDILVDKPTSMRQLRPISLCTVIYKTVSKVLVNRMKSILPTCISKTQAAFVQGRAITDNILVAHEIVHTLHTSVSRSSQGAFFKLDMEKAFDRVEWPFLKAVMLHLGFTPSWVDLIMRCVSSVSSRVRVRGLSAALTAAQCEGHLPDVRASKHGPPVNHLLSADDSLVFLRNNMSEVHCLKDILSTYSTVSGQKVNFSKSTAYFSPRTPSAHRIAVHETLGVQEVDDPGICLGVPLLIGKNKFAAFGRYRDKVHTRVSKWSNLLLSFSGREVLIKSVAQALPQYVMSCYLLPCTLVEDMSRSIRRFWWSGKGSAHGWPLAGFAGSLLSAYQATVVDWLGFVASSLSLSSFALLLSVLWGIRRRRNTWVHERSLYPLQLVVEDAVLLCLDYASACAFSQIPPPAVAALPRWCPPSIGYVKVNVDGAFLPSARLGAIGVVARNSSGAVLGGFVKPIPVHGPASTVEVSALFAGLKFAVANAWPSALIESDATVLVNKLHRPAANLSLLGDMLAPSRALVAANAARLRVGFAPRLANIAAHRLASWACHNNDVISFSSVCPELISRIVLDDLSSSF